MTAVVTRVLMYGHQNPKGRGLVQKNDELIVLSECCEATIDALYRKANGETWLRCNECDRPLQHNDRMWNCHVQRLTQEAASAESWRAWGLDLFGLEEFGLKVTE